MRPREFDQQAVIEAAMQVFWSHGFAASSTETLCKQTGLGRSSLYNTFGCKQALYEQALAHYHDLGIKTQLDILQSPGTNKQRLRKLLQWGVSDDLASTERRSCMALFAMMEKSGSDPTVAQLSRIFVQRIEQALCQLFTAGQGDGEFSPQRPAIEMARAFLASYYGLRILGQAMPDSDFLHDTLEGILANL